MELTFGIVFFVLLVGSTIYAIGRTVYEKWINPPPIVDHDPAVIPFHTAYRIADQLARDRVLAEAPTTVIVLPRNDNGEIFAAEQRNPGARTVDMQDRNNTGRHRQVLPFTGNNPYTGKAQVVAASAERAA